MIIFTKCCCHLYWSYLLSIQIKCYFILWWHEAVISDRCCFYCGPRLATLADTNSAFWAAALVSTHSFPFYWDQSSLSDKQSFSPSFLTLRMFLFLTPSFFPPQLFPGGHRAVHCQSAAQPFCLIWVWCRVRLYSLVMSWSESWWI